MKKILFVINTLGRAGAERALLELLGVLDLKKYQADLFVLSGQGEFYSEIPEGVTLLNRTFDPTPVLSSAGTRRLVRWLLLRCLRRGTFVRRFPYLVKNAWTMKRDGTFSLNRLTRRLLADVADPVDQEYDLAVAYLEGGASFYVDERVKAKKKAAFIHVDYRQAGYNRMLDQDCFLHFDRIFAVSDEVKASFCAAYPECEGRTEVFHNLVNRERILAASGEAGGFSDSYQGFRILTVGRLYAQKAFEVSIDAMKLLREAGAECRWYVLGEGEEKEHLLRRIRENGLEQDFILLGAAKNPYPYYAACDLYVHASRYEGKSIAVQEAQILGCPIIVSDCSGNREQVEDGKDGLFCELTSESIRDTVLRMYTDPKLRERLGRAASERQQTYAEETAKLEVLLD